jgi:hypothetical protein
MRSYSLRCLAIAFPLVAAMLAATVQAAVPMPTAGKSPAPTSQPAQQIAIPTEALRTTLQNLQKTAAIAEAKNTPPGQATALEHYRRMQQILVRFPDLKIDAAYKDSLARKIEDLQAKVTDNARQAATRERAERAARSARERAASYVASGGGFSLQGSGGGFAAGGASRGGAACPPGMVRTGST